MELVPDRPSAVRQKVSICCMLSFVHRMMVGSFVELCIHLVYKSCIHLVFILYSSCVFILYKYRRNFDMGGSLKHNPDNFDFEAYENLICMSDRHERGGPQSILSRKIGRLIRYDSR